MKIKLRVRETRFLAMTQRRSKPPYRMMWGFNLCIGARCYGFLWLAPQANDVGNAVAISMWGLRTHTFTKKVGECNAVD